MNIPYTILGGYLGTGKTTLLNHLLAENDGLKLALLINDFGAINIDSKLIAEQTDDQINLTNGCVCCGLSAGFDSAIESLLERDPLPDRIIVEASGVADVVTLAQYGHHPGLVLDGVLVVADAETVQAKASDKYVAATVTRQLQGADLIILNKTDLVSADRVAALTAWLAELAPATPVVPTSHCRVPVSLLLDVDGDQPRGAPATAHHHERYATWHFEHATPLPRERVDAFIESLPDTVLRAKGFFNISPGQRWLYQQVGGRRTLEPDNSEGGSELVVIGLDGLLRIDRLDGIASMLIDDV